MGFIDMLDEIETFSLESRLISTADVAAVIALVLDFLLGVTLLCKLIDDDGGNYVGK
jgi:hypothetical protein